MSFMVSVNVIVERQEEAAKVAEILARTAVGVALEGFYASMNISTTSDDEDPT